MFLHDVAILLIDLAGNILKATVKEEQFIEYQKTSNECRNEIVRLKQIH